MGNWKIRLVKGSRQRTSWTLRLPCNTSRQKEDGGCGPGVREKLFLMKPNNLNITMKEEGTNGPGQGEIAKGEGKRKEERRKGMSSPTGPLIGKVYQSHPRKGNPHSFLK